MQYDDMPQVARNFLSYSESIRGKSERTVHEYYYDLRTFFRYLKCSNGLAEWDQFDSVPVNDLSIRDLESLTISDLYNYMFYVNKNRSNSARSRARKVSSLRSFFSFLMRENLIEKNPAKDLESPKLPSSLPVHLTLDESAALLNAVSGAFAVRDFAILTLFLNCGMRLSELVGIDLQALHGDTLTVVGKGNKERTIYLNQACIDALTEYLKFRAKMTSIKDRDALFISRNGTRISNRMVQTMVDNTLTKAGLDHKKFSTHKLRHTAATLMYQKGNVDIRSLQAILGHEQLSTTQIYTHIDDDKLRSAVASNPLANFRRNEEHSDNQDTEEDPS